MTIIDQRILVPTAPENVWDIISNINNNPKWQADCQTISFLTSLRSGPNVRWRYTSPSGQDYVVETTAWYDGLGYEYTFIDGAPFRTSKGTIRLQEIPEGTVVQWTLTYELGGVLSGLRDSLTIRRQFDSIMVSSLKALWTHIKETSKSRPSHEPKSLMRDALDYEARAQYTPRHPSRFAEREIEQQAAPRITEPPVADEDTRPNPALAPTTSDTPAEEPALVEKPTAHKEWVSPPDSDLARFQRPPQPEVPPASPEPAPVRSVSEEAASIPIAAELRSDVHVSEPTPASAETPSTPEPVQVPKLEITEPEKLPADSPMLSDDDFGPKIDTSKLDTREISIWEVFGLPRPSETQRMKAITDADIAAAEAADAAKAAPPETSLPAAAEKSEPPVHPEPVIESSSAASDQPTAHQMIIGEETRPNVPLRMTASPSAVFSLPGFRARLRRKRVLLRRRH